jgi:hypothetical protein
MLPPRVAVLATVLLGALHQACAAPVPAKIFQFGGMYSADSGNSDPKVATPDGYNPVPLLWRWDPMVNGVPSPRARLTYRWQQSGATAVPPRAWRAFLVSQDAATVIGENATVPHALADTLAWFQKQGYPIDYVFADLEGNTPEGDWSNVNALLSEVRRTAVGAHAAIGNFDWSPGRVNLAADYPWYADRRTISRLYGAAASNGLAGLTVAMPVAYTMQSYELHASDTASWGAAWWQNSKLPESLLTSLSYNQRATVGSPYLSPNERAGMFYGPLEQVSLAKRNLPAGHQLIPWVSAFQSQRDVPRLPRGMLPTLEDNKAMLEHLRLRGADGYYAFGLDGSQNEGSYVDGFPFTVPPSRTYAAAMAPTWHALDWFFALPVAVGNVAADRPLNLYTFKNTGGTFVDPGGRNGGLEWSGYQRGNRVLTVISNLGNGAQAATGPGTGPEGNWTSVFASLGAHLAAQSPIVPAGNHLVVQYLSNPTLLNFDGYPPGSTLGSANGWHSSGATLRVARAAGSGASGTTVLAITGASTTAWVASALTANPGGIGTTINDAMVYTCTLYTGWLGEGSASFGPVVGGGSAVPVSVDRQGPAVWTHVGGPTSRWKFGPNLASGGVYDALNAAPVANTWYALAMVVNPATNRVSIYVQNITDDIGWVLLTFNVNGETATAVPAGLTPATQSPSLYNGFEISGSPGAQFADLGATLYAYPASPASSFDPSLYVPMCPSVRVVPEGPASQRHRPTDPC